MKKLLVTILFLVSTVSYAQLTVTGTVVDEQNQPLPFVTISVKNTNLGTTTNTDGYFTIRLKRNRGKIQISYIGYATQTLRVNPRKKKLKIVLKEETSQLDEIVMVTKPKKRLKKKENPAYKILKEIWKRKKKNGLQQVNHYQYKKHLTTEIGLNNLDSSFLKAVFKDDYDKTINQIQFDEDGINYYIPVYLKEVVYNIYGDNQQNKVREDIEAEKTKGVFKQGFIFNRMSNSFNNVDIYKNDIPILKKTFVSPISTAGFETYDYVLHDSITVNNRKFYSIYFFPIRNGDLAFEGNFLVADKIYSISKIKMKVHKDINLNFVRNLEFEKEFSIKNDSIYLPKKNIYTGDFTLLDKNEKNKGITIRKISTFTDYEFNQPKKPSFYNEKITQYSPKQFFKPLNYWKKNSNSNNALTYQLIENVKKKKKIKRLTGIINTLASGYVNVSPTLQIGPFWTAFAQNEVEGYRLKAGFRSFKTIHDRFRVSGHLAYGTKDKKFKYAIGARYLLTYKSRISAGIAYTNDIEQLGSKLLNTNQLLGQTFGTSALFSRGDNFFLSRVQKISTNLDAGLHKNLHVGLNFTHANIKSAAPNLFKINYLDPKTNTEKNTVKDVASDVYISYTPGRFVYGLGVEQRFGKNIFPTLVLNWRKGYSGFLNGDFSYNKLQFLYSQPILLGKFGVLDATLEAGKTFGKAPLSLLSPVPANQTFSLVRNTFSLMNYYDFVTDTYLTGHFEHHFNGFVLNRIPLLKKLKLRSIVSFRAAYGTISKENIALNKSSITYNAPSKKLYYEYSVGLENIGYGNIRFLRIDAIWRSNYKQVNTAIPTSPKFAIRIGIKPGF